MEPIMFKKTALFICAIASLVSFNGYADDVEETSKENVLTCRDCNLVACSCDKTQEQPQPETK